MESLGAAAGVFLVAPVFVVLAGIGLAKYAPRGSSPRRFRWCGSARSTWCSGWRRPDQPSFFNTFTALAASSALSQAM
jgi:hypothetical protein